jgi:hypothetical protein
MFLMHKDKEHSNVVGAKEDEGKAQQIDNDVHRESTFNVKIIIQSNFHY